MKTVDLTAASLNTEQLLNLAAKERVIRIRQGTRQFLLREADDFEAEVAELGESPRFMEFLRERFRQGDAVALQQVEAELKSREEAGP